MKLFFLIELKRKGTSDNMEVDKELVGLSCTHKNIKKIAKILQEKGFELFKPVEEQIKFNLKNKKK